MKSLDSRQGSVRLMPFSPSENHGEKNKEQNVVFIDLEKAYDEVPRQEVWKCMRTRAVLTSRIRRSKNQGKKQRWVDGMDTRWSRVASRVFTESLHI